MSYAPPPGASVSLVFSSGAYSRPPGGSVTLEFLPPAGTTILAPSLGVLTAFGTPGPVFLWNTYVDLDSRGFYAGEFGAAPDVDYHRLRPLGVEQDDYGTPFVWLAQQWALPDGLDAGAAPYSAAVYHQRDYAFDPTEAPNSSALVLEFSRHTYTPFATAKTSGATLDLEFAWPYPKPFGWASASFGGAQVQHFGQLELDPAGFQSDLYGTPVITSVAHVLLSGFVSAALGTPVLEWTLFVAPPGTAVGAFGVTNVQNKNRSIVTAVFDASRYGTATFINSTTYTEPYGFADETFGSAMASAFNRELTVLGMDDGAVPAPTIALYGIWNATIPYFPVWSLADVYNATDPRPIKPSGMAAPDHNIYIPIHGQEMRVELKDRTLLAHTWLDDNFGDITIFPHYITPKGVAPPTYLGSIFGATWVSNWIRYLEPQPWDSAKVWNDYGPVDPATGLPADVRNANFGFDPLGWTETAFGAAGVQLYTRTIEIADSVAAPSMSPPRVHAENTVAPGGIYSAVFGDVDRWEAGKIKAHGDDMARYGQSRIDRRVIASGWDSLAVTWPHMAVPIYTTGIAAPSVNPPAVVAPYDCYGRVAANITVPAHTRGDDGMGASRVVGTTATVPPHPIWGGLLVTDGSSAFYSTPVSCSGLGAGAFGSAAVST